MICAIVMHLLTICLIFVILNDHIALRLKQCTELAKTVHRITKALQRISSIFMQNSTEFKKTHTTTYHYPITARGTVTVPLAVTVLF